jgi:hypothetical protein
VSHLSGCRGARFSEFPYLRRRKAISHRRDQQARRDSGTSLVEPQISNDAISRQLTQKSQAWTVVTIPSLVHSGHRQTRHFSSAHDASGKSRRQSESAMRLTRSCIGNELRRGDTAPKSKFFSLVCIFSNMTVGMLRRELKVLLDLESRQR